MLKSFFKSIIPIGLRRLYYASKYERERGHLRDGAAPDKARIAGTFTDIYHSNHWGSEESVSGVGSTEDTTSTIRRGIRQVIDQYGITSILDIPCGDFNWMRHTDLHGVQYIGADIVAELIAENEARFGKDGHYRFMQLDLTSDVLPKVDLVFTRDCLPHLSYEAIGRALKNIKASGAKYLLTTTFPATIKNFDIRTGDFRAINLGKSPFRFPRPVMQIREDITHERLDYPDKRMMLWEVASLPDGL